MAKQPDMSDRAVSERRAVIGVLLRNLDLTLVEIAREVGVTPQTVGYVQKNFFPQLCRTNRGRRPAMVGTAAEARRRKIGELLQGPGSLSLREIARQVGVSAEAVRQTQEKYFPEFHRPRGRRANSKPRVHSIRSFKQAVIRMLRSTGATWCYVCCQVKCLDDFHPRARRVNGLACKRCCADRMNRQFRDNPKIHQYSLNYRKTHQEVQLKANKKWRAKHRAARTLELQYKRLEKYAPLLADAVRHGELTLEEAMLKLRASRKPWIRVRLTVKGFARAIRLHLTSQERIELGQVLNAEQQAEGAA